MQPLLTYTLSHTIIERPPPHYGLTVGNILPCCGIGKHEFSAPSFGRRMGRLFGRVGNREIILVAEEYENEILKESHKAHKGSQSSQSKEEILRIKRTSSLLPLRVLCVFVSFV
jgi:hypothetical protein